MNEPLSEHELAGWRAAVRNVQLKSTKVDVSKMSDAERFLATIDTLTTQLAEMTMQRAEAWSNAADANNDLAYVTASKNVAERERDGAWAETNRHVELLRRTLDRALIAEQRVKELEGQRIIHKPIGPCPCLSCRLAVAEATVDRYKVALERIVAPGYCGDSFGHDEGCGDCQECSASDVARRALTWTEPGEGTVTTDIGTNSPLTFG